MKHTRQELAQWQALPLNIKVRMTQQRIRDWVREYGENGVFVSFSGGKDSTVLLHIARSIYPNMRAMFCNTGLEYPEIVKFVKSFDNVDIIRPKRNFKQVIKHFGYPFISKEVSGSVYYEQKYLTSITQTGKLDRPTDRPTDYGLRQLLNREKITKNHIPDELIKTIIETGGHVPYKVKEMYGLNTTKGGKESKYNYSKWLPLCVCPYPISSHCCNVMKKAPIHAYENRTKSWAMTGQMASESRLRTQKWLAQGCNAYDLKRPISNPMAFWTEQDVLLYIMQNNVKIASVYGDVVVDYEGMEMIPGQQTVADYCEMDLFDLRQPLLKTTGLSRTGCMFCGYGAHLEKSPNRFERMKETHPKLYDYIMRPSGLNYKAVIDWLNENAGTDIKY